MVGTPAAGDVNRAGEPGTGWGRVPALDGVRGVAVAAVLLFHGGVSWARGGFLGVDAFFVLSGLLITSLLLEEARREGRIDLRRFWARRARRLLPALLAVVVAAAAWAAAFGTPDVLDGLRKDALATLAYVANWRYIAAGSSYFESTAAPSVLRHTWSLAIEEQFYVAWPLVVLVVAGSARRLAWVAGIAGAGVAASALAMALVHEPGVSTSRAYFGTDTRAHVVLTGALLAALVAVVRQRGPLPVLAARGLGWAAAAGSVMFVGATFVVDGSERSLYQGGFLAVSLGVALLLAHIVLVPGGWSARALAWPPLRALGLVSYGLYVWHWPIYLTLTAERTGLSGPALLAARLVVTGAAAAVSYFALEMPIRRGALPRLQAATVLPVAVAVAVVAVLLATVPPATPTTVATSAPVGDGTARPAPLRPPRPAGEPAKVLLVGDSIAKTLGMHYVKVDHRHDVDLVNAGVLGCGVVRGGPYRYFGDTLTPPRSCETWPEQWARLVKRHDPDVVLVIVGRWEVMDRVRDGAWTHVGEPAFDAYLEDEVERAVAVLSAGDAIVAFTTAPYFKRGERPDGGQWPEDDPDRVDGFNAILRRVVARNADRSTILDLNGRTSRGGRYTPVVDGVDLRFDGVHFSPAGAKWLEQWLLGEAEALAPPPVGGRRATTTTTAARTATTARGPSTTRRSGSTTTTTDDDSPPSTRAPRTTTTTAPTTTTSPPTTLLPRP